MTLFIVVMSRFKNGFNKVVGRIKKLFGINRPFSVTEKGMLIFAVLLLILVLIRCEHIMNSAREGMSKIGNTEENRE
jgi:ABC-type branched-subunit amino acid transport system permease subunit